jgi:hypothetical protein
MLRESIDMPISGIAVSALSWSENNVVDGMKKGPFGLVVGKTQHLNRNILYAFAGNSSEISSKIQ